MPPVTRRLVRGEAGREPTSPLITRPNHPWFDKSAKPGKPAERTCEKRRDSKRMSLKGLSGQVVELIAAG